MFQCTCAVCRQKFLTEDPAILTMSKYGAPRFLCETCEELLDTASGDGNFFETADAKKELGKRAMGMKDTESFAVLQKVLEGEITAEETEEDDRMEEEWEEYAPNPEEEEEDKEEQAREEKTMSLVNLITAILFGGAMLAFIVWMIFFR